MNEITTVVNLLLEMDELGKLVAAAEHGPTQVIARERDTISRLLSTYRTMSKSEWISTSTSNPVAVIDKLRRFRRLLKKTLADMGIPLTHAKDVTAWNKSCERVMAHASAYAAGSTGKTPSKLAELEKRRDELKKSGLVWMEKAQLPETMLPVFAVNAVKNRITEMDDSVDYVLNTRKPAERPGGVAPLRLVSYCGKRTGFEGLPDVPAPRPPYSSRVRGRLSLLTRKGDDK